VGDGIVRWPTTQKVTDASVDATGLVLWCIAGDSKEGVMRTWVLFVLAAVVFSILTGVIEASWARRRRRSLKQKWPVLHPLTRHRLRGIQYLVSARAVYHVGLFFGFLLLIYVGGLLLNMGLREVVWVISSTFGYDDTVRVPAACR